MTDSIEIVSLLKPLLKPLSEGVIVCNRNGLVLTANDAVYSLFGLDRNSKLSLSNLNGHNLRSSLIRAGINGASEGGDYCETIMDFEEQVNVTGVTRWFRIDSSLLDIPSNDDRLRMIVLRDITAEKRLTAVIGEKDSCGFVSEDPDMLRLLERIKVVAASDASVLFQGESGTGKTELRASYTNAVAVATNRSSRSTAAPFRPL